jgi:hypothetical protein
MTLASARSLFLASARKVTVTGNRTLVVGVSDSGRPIRFRRITIVALARKLLVALWRYLETGVVPQGAVLKG